MFEQFILASSLQRIEKRFNMAQLPESAFSPSYNIKPGSKTLVLAQGHNNQFQQYIFGLLLHNNILSFIRAEGNKNSNDDPCYSGSKSIFLMPDYKKLIRFKRCIIPADAFIMKKLADSYYLVYLQQKKRPFAFAGVYLESTEGERSFAIITVPANPLLAQLNQKRMPVIIYANDESRWLKDDTPLSKVLQSLCIYPAKLMNAYPVAAPPEDINNVSLVKPIGDSLYQEQQDFKLQGRKQKKPFSSTTSFADRRKPS